MLKSEPEAEIGQKGTFCKGLERFFQIYYDDRLNRILDCMRYKQFEIHNPKSKGPVAQLG